MVDVAMIAAIVVFFVAAALLVRVLGRVTDAATTEREPDLGEAPEVTAGQTYGLMSDGRK
jgi:hypothetical protein